MKSYTQQDLRDARALLEQNGSDDERKKYRKAAEIILLKATRLDPENEEAKILLQSVRGVPAPSPLALPQPQQPQQLPLRDGPALTASTLFANPGTKKRSLSKILFGLIGVLVVGVGIIGMHGMSSSSAASSPVTRTPNAKQEALPAAPVPQGDKRLGLTPMITIQINAKPWAQVFVDGAPRRALGQTPLSGIRVPVGSVLVFENPNFASKTRRVTENDTEIQLNFQ